MHFRSIQKKIVRFEILHFFGIMINKPTNINVTGYFVTFTTFVEEGLLQTFILSATVGWRRKKFYFNFWLHDISIAVVGFEFVQVSGIW